MAFEPLGWRPLAFSEIEAFPRAVLKHHYPDTPCHGDFTTLKDEPWIVDADILCGGTPCQAFSVAGNRQSLADNRGNLTLQFVLLANAIDHLRSTAGREPAWILWENVPGVLSTNDNAFGAFLGGLVGRSAHIPEPEGGWTGAGVVDGPTRCAAWRVLDAQHFGLAQRRKRVFVLARGGAGRWAVADALLPIIEGSRWHPAPSRGMGEGVAATITSGAANGGPAHGARSGSAKEGNLIPEVTRPLTAAMGTKWNGNGDLESSLIPSVAHTMRGEGFDASEDGTGRGIPLVMATGQASAMSAPTIDMAPTLSCNHEAPILMRMREGKEGGGKGPLVSEDQSLTLATANDQILAFKGGQGEKVGSLGISERVSPTLGAADSGSNRTPLVAIPNDQVLATPIAWDEELNPTVDMAGTTVRGGDGGRHAGVMTGMQVRRLTPIETARLQGFPDTYCHIPTGKWRKIPTDEAAYLQSHGLHAELRGEQWYTNITADGPIYKANGNSWAVPCARWIGERIKAIRP